ncbi:MAG: hypothetical protein HON90_03020 [Halobacteriovoraceae bacterium]|nr:hypothetical protein [Halobacteriovoraceae bacterium]
MDEYIKVKGARVNNLKNVSYKIPLNKLTCIMGLSGSGKTSLAFHTLYNESKRRFLNSFPTYLKFFSDRPAAVDVDEIKPVLPVFGLPQINPVVGARSNVSDIMHLTELFQNHFYHYSEELCPLHKIEFKPYYLSNYLQTIVSADGAEVYHVLIKADDFLNSLAGQVLPTRSMKSSRARKILEFDKSHELWEVARFKQKHLSSIDEKLNDVISQNLQIYLYSIRLNKVIPVHYKKNQFYCEVAGCDEQKVPSRSALNFSPYNAIGACDECGGFGEVLSYDIAKLVDQEKSICEDGVLFLNYKRFLSQKDELIKVLKKKKISLTDPIKKLPKAFWKILYEGEDKYTGFDSYFRYLERKKYKMHVRIFIRNIQKGEACTSCAGTRLSYAANQFFIDTSGDISLAWAMGQSVQSLYTVLGDPSINLKRATNESKKSLKKILEILKAAIAIGLGHLHVLRKAKSLSAGEYQRLLLIKYLSYEGTGALFIFDEPSLGLGQKELKGILASFKKLIENKNSVILIEHNINLIKAAD